MGNGAGLRPGQVELAQEHTTDTCDEEEDDIVVNNRRMVNDVS